MDGNQSKPSKTPFKVDKIDAFNNNNNNRPVESWSRWRYSVKKMSNYLENEILRNVLRRKNTELSKLLIASLWGWRQDKLRDRTAKRTFV